MDTNQISVADQCGRTMTVGDLIEYLSQFDEDTKVYLKNDGGYTFGSIDERSFEEASSEDEESEDEEDGTY